MGYGVGLGLDLGLERGLGEGAALLGPVQAGWPRRPAAASEAGREAAARARALGPLLRSLAEVGPVLRALARRSPAAPGACAGAPPGL